MSSTRRWDLWGALGGTVLGVCDTALLMARGVSFTLEGQDATLLVGAAFTSSFALLGFAIGALVRARARARRDADTIRRQLDRLGESQRALLQQEKLAAIGRLAAGVAHEVRNPLGVIRASTSMVRESFEPQEEPYRACDFILEEIDRLNGMITSLLTFSRPTELRLEAVSIEKTLDRALHLASEQLRERGIEAERAAEGTIPELRADPDLLAQVLTGLVINAAEAMPDGGRLQVRTNVDGGHACIDVADSGPGVLVEDASRVFEPFYTTKASGTGLGLAMAARIASAHDGDLALVEGAGAGLEGAGACFRLSLPLDGRYTGPESSA